MKELINISGTTVIPSAYVLTIPEFKDLKINELSAIFFFEDYRSPYFVYEEEERWEKISKDLSVKLNPKVQAGIDKYKELSETSAIKLLKSAKASVTSLEKYFRTIDLTAIDQNGRPINQAKDLVANLGKIADVVDGLNRLEDLVKKEQQKDNPNRGGVVVNKYSQ
jgi:hypothetical protein